MMKALLIDPVKANGAKLVKFGVVGVIGFLVDAAVLFLAMRLLAADPFSGRVASIAAAMLTTWILNRRFTFSAKSGAIVQELARYAIVKGVGLAANLSIYAVMVLLISKDAYPLVPLIVASAASLVVNFALVKRFVFSSA